MNSQMDAVSGHGCCGGSLGRTSPNSRFSRYLPTWLRGTRGIIIGAVAVAAGGAALGWPWLVAAGLAPILLSLAPCAAMCALGLCMMGKSGQSAGAQTTTPGPGIASAAPLLLSDEAERTPFAPSAGDREQATVS